MGVMQSLLKLTIGTGCVAIERIPGQPKEMLFIEISCSAAYPSILHTFWKIFVGHMSEAPIKYSLSSK